MSDLVCGTCHEPIIDGQGRFHPTHRLGKNSPHFHVACGETDPRDARIADLEAKVGRLRFVMQETAHVAATLGTGTDGYWRGRLMSISNALNAAIG